MKNLAQKSIFALFLGVAFVTTSGFSRSSQPQSMQLDREYRAAVHGFGTPGLEALVKDDLQRERTRDRKRFENSVSSAEDFGDSNESYLFEVRDGRKQIEMAKVVAKKTLFEAASRYWPGLEKSWLNEDVNARSFAEFAPFLRERLEKITYAPNPQSPNELVFDVDHWGQVIFKKSRGRIISRTWAIDTNGTH